MVREAYTNRPNVIFPNADQSIGFGWKFLKSNFILISSVDGLSALAAFFISVVPLGLSHDPAWYFAVPAWLLSRLAIVFGTVILIRRGLDFWDEQGEQNWRRGSFEAISAAFPAAARRLVPWVVFNLVIGMVVLAATFPLLVAASRVDSMWRLLFGALAIGIAVLLATRWVFVPIASADGPGDAITTSWEMTKERFWKVFGTLVQLSFVALFAWLPVLAVGWVFGNGWILLGVRVVYAVGLQALYIGASVNMYRALDKTVGRV